MKLRDTWLTFAQVEQLDFARQMNSKAKIPRRRYLFERVCFDSHHEREAEDLTEEAWDNYSDEWSIEVNCDENDIENCLDTLG